MVLCILASLGDIQRKWSANCKLASSSFDVRFKTCLTLVYIATQHILIWIVNRQHCSPSNKSDNKSSPTEIPKNKIQK